MNSECVWRVSSSPLCPPPFPGKTYESSSDGCGSLSVGHFRAYVPGIRNVGFRWRILSHPSAAPRLSLVSPFIFVAILSGIYVKIKFLFCLFVSLFLSLTDFRFLLYTSARYLPAISWYLASTISRLAIISRELRAPRGTKQSRRGFVDRSQSERRARGARIHPLGCSPAGRRVVANENGMHRPA